MNANIISENEGYEACMGGQRVGDRNYKRECFASFCSDNGLFVGGRFFQNKILHTFTWTSPGERTSDQIYNFTINQEWNNL